MTFRKFLGKAEKYLRMVSRCVSRWQWSVLWSLYRLVSTSPQATRARERGRTEDNSCLQRIVGFDIMSDEQGRRAACADAGCFSLWYLQDEMRACAPAFRAGFPYIPFHLDLFRAIRKVVESITRRTFGFRIHCGESVPFPLGDVHHLRASTSVDLDRARKLHMAIEEMCVHEIFRRTFRYGTSDRE